MDSASQLLYWHLGTPPVDGVARVEPGQCWVCGGSAEIGKPWDEWAGSNFVGQNKVSSPESTIVCAACCYLSSRLSPVPGRPPKPGKKLGGNYRNYSHVYDDGAEQKYRNFSKSEKRELATWLRSEHRGRWFAAIAESGQKHVLISTPVNEGRTGWLLFEETLVFVGRSQDQWRIIDATAELMALGIRKGEIETARYATKSWITHRRSIEAYERLVKGSRGGGLFALSVWLAQEEETNDQNQRGDDGGTPPGDGASHSGGEACVSRGRGKPNQALGADPDPHSGGGAIHELGGGVGERAGPRAPAAAPQQGSLFADDAPRGRGKRGKRTQ